MRRRGDAPLFIHRCKAKVERPKGLKAALLLPAGGNYFEPYVGYETHGRDARATMRLN